MRQLDQSNSMETEYADFPKTCRPWLPIKRKIANITDVSCFYDNTDGKRQWVIRDFDRIESRQVLAFDFKLYWQKESPKEIPIEIGIYGTAGELTSLQDYTPP